MSIHTTVQQKETALLTDTYDDTEYDAGISAHTHPAYLGAIASLFGVAAPDVSKAKILEIGCGVGYNLFSIAASLPESVCVGIDISTKQIERGRQKAEELNLSNVILIAEDATKLVGELKGFDYVISHGVYSWVPDHVREQFFHFCSSFMSPHGLLYASYNTFPGWYDYGLLRNLYKQLAPGQPWSSELNERIDNWINALPEGPLRERYEQLWFHKFRDLPEFYKSHGIFGHFNEPRYITEVVHHAAQSGLSYVSDVTLSRDLPLSMFHEVSSQSLHLPRIEQLQLLDTVQNNSFRASLFRKTHYGDALNDQKSTHEALQITSVSRLSLTPRLISLTDPSEEQRNVAHERYPLVTRHDNTKYYQRRGSQSTVVIPIEPPSGRDLLDAAIEAWPSPLPLLPFIEQCKSDASKSDTLIQELLVQLITFLKYQDLELLLDAPEFLIKSKSIADQNFRPKLTPLNAHYIKLGLYAKTTVHLHKHIPDHLQDHWLPFTDLFDGTRNRSELLLAVSTHPRYASSALSQCDQSEQAVYLDKSLELYRQVGFI